MLPAGAGSAAQAPGAAAAPAQAATGAGPAGTRAVVRMTSSGVLAMPPDRGAGGRSYTSRGKAQSARHAC
ncbi:hypothetical protein SCWH03_04070 [Streptomyces pacificus]|uniref:Uncharacterized protein n=1 Tax=Streptomyces pacificus TaxID=2705029 RepID=A0A6A0ARK8_9ACTN|nr:hypothetical protein SCWH03_04070 [Streptomyces pacificus]